MPQLEYKAAEKFELSELNTEHRTAIIAHAVYDNIDRAGDVAKRGMFTKSWKENKAIDFLIDHDKNKRPGQVIGLFDDEKKAYTKVKFSQSTLGTDTMLMMDEGLIKGASFGFYTIKATTNTIKGRKVRELREVIQDETTVTYAKNPVNPIAGVVKVTKADMEVLHEYKSHIDRLEHFCRNTTASDDTIINILAEVKAAREVISQYDTADTQLITEPTASRNGNDSIRKTLLLINSTFQNG
jgi:HK97 family phage prohead protease